MENKYNTVSQLNKQVSRVADIRWELTYTLKQKHLFNTNGNECIEKKYHQMLRKFRPHVIILDCSSNEIRYAIDNNFDLSKKERFFHYCVKELIKFTTDLSFCDEYQQKINPQLIYLASPPRLNRNEFKLSEETEIWNGILRKTIKKYSEAKVKNDRKILDLGCSLNVHFSEFIDVNHIVYNDKAEFSPHLFKLLFPDGVHPNSPRAAYIGYTSLLKVIKKCYEDMYYRYSSGLEDPNLLPVFTRQDISKCYTCRKFYCSRKNAQENECENENNLSNDWIEKFEEGCTTPIDHYLIYQIKPKCQCICRYGSF